MQTIQHILLAYQQNLEGKTQEFHFVKKNILLKQPITCRLHVYHIENLKNVILPLVVYVS